MKKGKAEKKVQGMKGVSKPGKAYDRWSKGFKATKKKAKKGRS